MKLLLDTHLLLWAAGSPDRLSAAARPLLEDPLNELLFSAASLWEIGLKKAMGKLDIPERLGEIKRGLPNGRHHLRRTFFPDSSIFLKSGIGIIIKNPKGDYKKMEMSRGVS